MYLMLFGLTAFILLPVGWMLTAALKPDLEPVFTPTPEWFPTDFWEWYELPSRPHRERCRSCAT